MKEGSGSVSSRSTGEGPMPSAASIITVPRRALFALQTPFGRASPDESDSFRPGAPVADDAITAAHPASRGLREKDRPPIAIRLGAELPATALPGAPVRTPIRAVDNDIAVAAMMRGGTQSA
mmetsp:Transcript_34070/g.85769  ORF Transcript_34070/g.85769 Transcript_34070/m.85769 type:complete len:122 (-) Transcript_34070:34-399(-)